MIELTAESVRRRRFFTAPAMYGKIALTAIRRQYAYRAAALAGLDQRECSRKRPCGALAGLSPQTDQRPIDNHPALSHNDSNGGGGFSFPLKGREGRRSLGDTMHETAVRPLRVPGGYRR